MKVYGPSIPAPKYDFDVPGDWEEKDKKYLEDLKRSVIDLGYTGNLTGETVHFGIADGYAVYMVICGPNNTKMALVHCQTGGDYQLPEAQLRGYTKKDIIQMINRKKHPLFGSSS